MFGTADAGKHWSVLSRPVLPGATTALLQGQVDMYFADARHGYIFTAARCQRRCVLSTADGGRSWARNALPPVAQLIGGDDVFALTTASRRHQDSLSRSTIGSRRWTQIRLPAAATQHVSADASRLFIAADGPSVALLRTASVSTRPGPSQLGKLWLSTDSGDTWQLRANPCTVRDGGAALVSIALNHPNALLIDCFDGEQSSQAMATQHHLYGSADDATDWVRLADPSDTGAPVLLADNGSGHAALAVETGGADVLMATLDGAAHWHSAISTKWGFYGWADLRFVNANDGFIFGPTHYAKTSLYRTLNAGRAWKRIPLPRTLR